MRAGIDNYGLFPLNLDPLMTLKWALENGAEGVAFSGIRNRTEEKLPDEYLDNIYNYARENNLYLEWGGGQHLPWDIPTNEKKDIYPFNRIVAEEAAYLGTNIVRSCSGGCMRWSSDGPKTSEYLEAMAVELKKLRPILKDLGVVWAIETHFEFTSFELIRLFETSGFYPGEQIGICLDTMNLLTMLEDPLKATERLLPWIVSTHIKDGGLVLYDEGLRSYPAPIGHGWIQLEEIIRMIRKKDPHIHLNAEDHNGSFLLPIHNQEFTNEFPDLHPEEFRRLIDLACTSQSCKDTIEEKYFNRAIWPDICEARMQQDIAELVNIRNQIEHE